MSWLRIEPYRSILPAIRILYTTTLDSVSCIENKFSDNSPAVMQNKKNWFITLLKRLNDAVIAVDAQYI